MRGVFGDSGDVHSTTAGRSKLVERLVWLPVSLSALLLAFGEGAAQETRNPMTKKLDEFYRVEATGVEALRSAIGGLRRMTTGIEDQVAWVEPAGEEGGGR